MFTKRHRPGRRSLAKFWQDHFSASLSIAPFQIERFKHERREGLTFRGTQRAPASVNRELELLVNDVKHVRMSEGGHSTS